MDVLVVYMKLAFLMQVVSDSDQSGFQMLGPFHFKFQLYLNIGNFGNIDFQLQGHSCGLKKPEACQWPAGCWFIIAWLLIHKAIPG